MTSRRTAEPLAVRLAWSFGLILLGLVIGLAGAFVQAHRLVIPMGEIAIPWGVPLVWVALVAAIRAGAWALHSRWGSWGVLAGWLGATILLATESPSGDLALSSGTRQMVYLLGGVILGSAAATLPARRPVPAPPAPAGGTPPGATPA